MEKGAGVTEEHFMARAIALAASVPFTSPNPKVGAVVVRDGEVLAEGRHLGAGHPHAEAAAIEGVDARGATLYVNLEPCCHVGRTPPCTELLIDAGVARVVVGCEDPDPRVSGNGVRRLREAGVEVVEGVMEQEARDLNLPFFTRLREGRSFVTLKLALTLDGRLAAADGSSRWITGPESRRHAHSLRRSADAVLVGAATVLSDDPLLTVRHVETSRQPVRIIADARGVVPPGSRLLASADVAPVIIATTARCPHDTAIAYKEAGAEVLLLPEDEGGIDLGALLRELAARGMNEVLCEGGARLATALVRRRLADRLELHYAPVATGGGPVIGDLGIPSMDHAMRFRTRSIVQRGADWNVTLLAADSQEAR